MKRLILTILAILFCSLVSVGQTYSYNFNDGTLQGWENITVNNDGGVWLHSDNNPGEYDYTDLGHSGDGFAMSYSFIDYDGAYDTENYLKSPQQYNISQSSTLNFWYDYANDSYPDYFEVCISTSANPTELSFTTIWNVNSNKKTNTNIDCRYHRVRYENWRYVSINLSSYAGQSIWIAFHHIDYDMYEVWIDDIEVTNINIITSPSNATCATATQLPCGTENLSGTTVGTTGISHGLPSDASVSNYGVWYTFEGSNEITTITISATGYDTEIDVVSGSCGSFTWVGYDDSGLSNSNDSYTFVTKVNVTYYVYVAHYSSSSTTTGSFTISRTCEELPDKLSCQVGDNWGISTDSYLPSYSFYNYSLTQQIYTSEEIGDADIIEYLYFYNGGSEKTRTFNIYMKHTSKSLFSNNSDWETVDDATLVWTGSKAMIANDWTEFELTTPFIYNGTSNLCLIIDDNTGSYSSGMTCRVYDAPSQAIRIYSDGTNYDPSTPTLYSGTIMNVKNQIKLCNEYGNTLPISLLSFTAAPQSEYNLVQWTTATEKNNDIFILERSDDAVVFDEVYNVSGAGSSLEPIDYEFRDYCPVPDITYYRLTQVDYDGSKTTSEMVPCIRTSEKMSNWEYFTKYDNLLQVHSNDKALDIICSDLLGRTIWQGKMPPHDDTELDLKKPYMAHIYEDGVLVGSEKVFR